METTLLNIDFGDTFQRLTEIKNATRELQEENKKLAESIDKVGDETGELNKQMQQNESAIRANAKEKRALNKLVDDSIKAEKAQKGSIEANRAELSKLTAEYIKLAKPTKEQTDRIKTLSDTLKKQEGALGDTRRNVGNYQSAMEGALKNVKIFGVSVGDTVTALKEKKTQLQATANSFGPVNFSMKGAVNGLKAFKVALISTGIGALILGLTTMAGLFLKSETGMELVNKAMTIFGAVVDTAIKRVEQFAKGVSFILNGEFSKGVDALSGSFKGLGEEIRNATAAASLLADAQETLEDAEIAFIERRAKIRAEIQDLRDLANDESKSLAERQLALQSALVLQGEQMATEQELAKMRIDNAEAEFAISAKTDDDRRKFEDAKAASFEDERDRTKEKIKLENELNALNKTALKEEKDRTSNIEELKKAVDDLAISVKDAVQNDSIDLEVKPTIDVPKIEAAVKEVKTRIKNILQDEEDSSLFQALGITDDNISFALESASTLVNNLDSIFQVQHENRLTEIEDKRLLEIEAVENSVASEQDKAARITQINEKYNNEKLKQEREFQRKQKASQITQAIINGALAVTNALATVQPFIPLGVAAAALAATATAVQVGTIAAQKFAEGGEIPVESGVSMYNIGGRSHKQGGTKFYGEDGNVIEMEAGEKAFVLKASASQFLEKYSALNQRYGGKSWTGQPVRHAALGGNIASSFDGGFATREALNGGSEFVRTDTRPIIVKVSEINKVQNDVVRTANVSEL